MQPLIGLIVTAVGAWLGRRGSKSPSVTQRAETHGANSPVEQQLTVKVDERSWHIYPPAPRSREPRAEQPPSGPEESEPWAWVVVVFGLFCVVALTWVLAAYWSPLATALNFIVLIAMFIMALTWHRWPQGVAGRWPLRVGIVVSGTAVLWALSALPVAVRGEPTLSSIAAQTRDMSVLDSLAKTGSILWLEGFVAYEVRLGGLFLLLMALCMMTSKALGAVIAESGARPKNPRMWMIRIGNRLSGSRSVGTVFFIVAAVLTVGGVLAVHPVSLGWLLDHIGPRLPR